MFEWLSGVVGRQPRENAPRSLSETSGSPAGSTDFAYDLFISYSRKDAAFVDALQNAFEAYRAPSSALPWQLKVFRDTQDLSGIDYPRAIARHLLDARKLVVVCSPNSRASDYVDHEIQTFITARGVDHVIPVLLAGTPNNECRDDTDPNLAFPTALVKHVKVPLASDFRGARGNRKAIIRPPFRNAWYMTLANVYGLHREVVEAREEVRRRSRRTRIWVSSAALALGLTGVFAWYAATSRAEGLSQSVVLTRNSEEALENGLHDRAMRLAVLAARGSWLSPATPTADAQLLNAATGSLQVAQLRTKGSIIAALFDPEQANRIVTLSTTSADVWGGRIPHIEETMPLTRQVSAASVSQDGSRAAGLTGDKAYVFDLASRREISSVTHTDAVAVELSPDGRWLVTQSAARLMVWDAERGSNVLTRDIQNGKTARTYGGPTVARFSHDGTVLVYNHQTNAVIVELGTARVKFLFHDRAVALLAISPDGRWIATTETGRGEKNLRIWDATSGGVATTVKLPQVQDLQFSPTGRHLLALPSLLNLDRLGADRQVTIEPGLSKAQPPAAFSADGQHIVATIEANAVCIWRRFFQDCPSVLRHSTDVTFVALNSDGSRVLTGAEDGQWRVWESRMSAWIVEAEHDPDIGAPAFSADGTLLLTAHHEAARLWNTASGTQVTAFQISGWAKSTGFRGVDPLIAGADHYGKTINVFNVKTSQLVASLEDVSSFDAAMFSPGAGHLAVYRQYPETATIWDVARSKKIAVVPAAKTFNTTASGGQHSFAAFSRDGTLVATVSPDNRLLVWNLLSGTLAADIEHNPDVDLVEFNTDGTSIVTGISDEKLLRIWQSRTGRLQAELKHDSSISHAAFAPSGREIVIADGRAQLWDLDTRRPSGDQFPESALFAVFDPRGLRVFTTSGALVIGWDPKTKVELWRYNHIQNARALGFSADGRYLATVGNLANGPARLFEPRWLSASRGPALIERICSERMPGMSLLTEEDTRFTTILEGRMNENVCASKSLFNQLRDAIRELWNRANPFGPRRPAISEVARVARASGDE